MIFRKLANSVVEKEKKANRYKAVAKKKRSKVALNARQKAEDVLNKRNFHYKRSAGVIKAVHKKSMRCDRKKFLISITAAIGPAKRL